MNIKQARYHYYKILKSTRGGGSINWTYYGYHEKSAEIHRAEVMHHSLELLKCLDITVKDIPLKKQHEGWNTCMWTGNVKRYMKKHRPDLIFNFEDVESNRLIEMSQRKAYTKS